MIDIEKEKIKEILLRTWEEQSGKGLKLDLGFFKSQFERLRYLTNVGDLIYMKKIGSNQFGFGNVKVDGVSGATVSSLGLMEMYNRGVRVYSELLEKD